MNQNILITGASRGIGRAAAIRFAADGNRLCLTCRENTGLLEELAGTLEKEHQTECLLFTGDLSHQEEIDRLFRMLEEQDCMPDVIINNAGRAYIGLLQDMSREDWQALFDLNVTAVFSIIKAALPAMLQKGGGCIVNISSVWGETGASCEAAYAATKGALNALTRSLGKELAPSHIRVNAISCGFIDTDMNRGFTPEEREAVFDRIPAGRAGTPEEAADLAFRIAGAGDYLTGQVIRLDGAWI